MKFKKLLILPLSALLIGCGGGFSTSVVVPPGGDKVVIDPEDSDSREAAATDVKSILNAVLSTPTFSGVGGYTLDVHLDTEFGMVVNHESVKSDDYSYESMAWGDFSLKGDIAVSTYVASNTNKYLRLKVRNLNFGVKITASYFVTQGTSFYKQSEVVFNDTFRGLKLAIDYVYNDGASDFYVDLSDASIAQIPTKIRNVVISNIKKADYESSEKQQDLAEANAIFNQVDQLVATYGKTHFSASEISGLVDLAKPSNDVSAMIKGLLGGDLITNAAAYIGNMINEKASDIATYLAFGAAYIISKKETSLVDYSKGNVTSYGFATTFNKDEIVGIASLFSEDESVEMEKASIGLAVVASNENPFGDMRLSLLDVKADLKVKDQFYIQGEVKLTLSYEKFVPLTEAQIATYKRGMELVNAIQSMIPKD